MSNELETYLFGEILLKPLICLRGTQQQSTCDISMFEDAEEDFLKFSPYPPNITLNDRLNKKCSCEVGTQVQYTVHSTFWNVSKCTQVCPLDSFGTPPPQVITPSGDLLVGEILTYSQMLDSNQNLLRYDWKEHIPVAVKDQG